MEIEIQDNDTCDIKTHNFEFCEGIISVKTKERVFIFGGDKYNIHLVFKNEKEFDDLLWTLNYFKIHKTYPPKE